MTWFVPHESLVILMTRQATARLPRVPEVLLARATEPLDRGYVEVQDTSTYFKQDSTYNFVWAKFLLDLRFRIPSGSLARIVDGVTPATIQKYFLV